MPPSDQPIWKMLRDFVPHVSSRRRKQFGLLMLLMLIGAGAELVTLGAVIPFIALMADPESAFEFPYLQQLFTTLGWRDPDAIVLPMTLLFLVLVSLATFVRLLLLFAMNRFVHALGYDIGVRLYNRVINQPYSFHITRNTSEVIAAVSKVQVVLKGAVSPVMDGLISITIALAIVTALILIEPVATLTAAGLFVTMYVLIAVFIRWRLKRNGKRIAAAQTERVRCVQEGLGGIRDILLDNSQQHYTQSYARVDRRLRTAQANTALLKKAPKFLIEWVGITLIIGLAFFLSMTTGGLIAALPVLGALALGAQRLMPLLQKIYDAWARMTSSHQMFADVLELLELPMTAAESGTANKLDFQREIRLEEIGFHYPRAEQRVLENIDLVIPRGTRVGIIGPTGSGKSTLVDIIMGLLVPDRGRLLIDGIPVTEDNRRAWQNHISHVPQHIFLADASIAENIAIGVPKKRIDRERVIAAARAARIHDYIESRPGQYDARVGERGIQLSGGQRQRIGIARAIYRQADVLVLDEATSALDNDTESAVMACIDDLGEELTVLMIAHRLTTLRNCDLIVALEKGRIRQVGNYRQVLGEQTENLSVPVDH